MTAEKDQRPHGPLISLSWNHWSNGMMMYSHKESSRRVFQNEAGEWLYESVEQSDMQGETRSTFRVDPLIPGRLREISDREDLPSWSELKEIPELQIQVCDYSAASSVTLVFDDRELGGRKEERFTINCTAAGHHGKGAVIEEILEILSSCQRPEMLISVEKKGPSAKVRDFLRKAGLLKGGDDAPDQDGAAGSDDSVSKPGPGVCPECGYSPVEGKFCPECGTQMPDKEQQGV